MPINPELSPLTPHEAAEAVGVGVQSIRRWCEWHAVHLSDSASPGPGIPRRLTRRDVEVLKAVKDLRYQGLQTEAINDRLAGMAFPEIDSPSDSAGMAKAFIDSPTAQDARHATPAPIVALDDLEKLLEALERSRIKEDKITRHSLTMFGAGFIAALLFVIVIVLLAVLYGGFR